MKFTNFEKWNLTLILTRGQVHGWMFGMEDLSLGKVGIMAVYSKCLPLVR